MDLEGHWTFYRCQAFMVAFFSLVLFPSQAGSISFIVLALVSTLPHRTSFSLGLFLCVVRLVVVGIVVVCISVVVVV